MDPLTTLAHQMQRKKGTYALLLGSGLSRSASIPTGWDIVLDLIRRVAAARGVHIEDSPEAWFQTEFGGEPGYSELLGQLADTQAERSLIIRDYIEPAEEERDLGLKSPTDAHRSR